MIKGRLQNGLTLLVMVAILIIISVSLGVPNTSLALIEWPEPDMFSVPFENQSREADLIILGHILDEKQIWEGSVGAALDNNTVSVEKVLKGMHNGNTIGVLTESNTRNYSPNFKQNEKVILFLHKEPLFGNKLLVSGNIYTIVNYPQGKYEVNDNGMISGRDIGNISMAGFEKKIKDALSGKANITELISNEAESYYYRNDNDTQFNDTGH